MKRSSQYFSASGPGLAAPNAALSTTQYAFSGAIGSVSPVPAGVSSQSITSDAWVDIINRSGAGVLDLAALQNQSANAMVLELVIDGITTTVTTAANNLRTACPVGVIAEHPYWNGSAVGYCHSVALGRVPYKTSLLLRAKRNVAGAGSAQVFWKHYPTA